MFGSEILEVALGVALLFLLVSLIASAASEMIEAVLQSRGRYLERGVQELLAVVDDDRALANFYASPLMAGLFRGAYAPKRRQGRWGWLRLWESLPRWWSRRRLPSYIPANVFAATILDLVARGGPGGLGGGGPEAGGPPAEAATSAQRLESLRAAASQFGNPTVRAAMLQAIDGAGEDVAKLRAGLEAWYNGAMDRVSGWYKRRTQLMLFLLGLGAAAVLNLDAITVTQRLAEDRALRQAVVASADAVAQREAAAVAARDDQAAQAAAYDDAAPAGDEARRPRARLTALHGELTAIGYPIGWRNGRPAPQREALCGASVACGWAEMSKPVLMQILLGWLVVALATTLGAPFWFDLLNKMMVIRSTVKPHEKSQNEGSEDRKQAPARTTG